MDPYNLGAVEKHTYKDVIKRLATGKPVGKKKK